MFVRPQKLQRVLNLTYVNVTPFTQDKNCSAESAKYNSSNIQVFFIFELSTTKFSSPKKFLDHYFFVDIVMSLPACVRACVWLNISLCVWILMHICSHDHGFMHAVFVHLCNQTVNYGVTTWAMVIKFEPREIHICMFRTCPYTPFLTSTYRFELLCLFALTISIFPLGSQSYRQYWRSVASTSQLHWQVTVNRINYQYAQRIKLNILANRCAFFKFSKLLIYSMGQQMPKVV